MKELRHGNLSSLEDYINPRYPYRRTERRLCGFELKDAEWVARPQLLFRPYALMLWGTPERAKVAHCIMGNEGQILVSAAPVPASFFATGHSFEDVVKRFVREGIDAPYWCDFKTFEVGTTMRLKVATEEGEPVRKLEAVLLGMAAL